MNKLYLRLRNYNTEIDVALSHFPNKEVGAEIRKHDLDTLMFKPGLLVEKNVDALKNLTSAIEEIHKKERELKDKTNIIRDLEIKKILKY